MDDPLESVRGVDKEAEREQWEDEGYKKQVDWNERTMELEKCEPHKARLKE